MPSRDPVQDLINETNRQQQLTATSREMFQLPFGIYGEVMSRALTNAGRAVTGYNPKAKKKVVTKTTPKKPTSAPKQTAPKRGVTADPKTGGGYTVSGGGSIPSIPNVGMGAYGKQLRQLVNDLLKASRSVPGTSLAELRTSLVDPSEFADAATNARYASAIEAIKRAQGEVGPQSALAQRDIGQWFDQTSGTLQSGMEAERSAYEAERGSLDSLSQALMQSIGGGANPAAGDLGGDALQSAGALAAVQQAGLNFGTNMGTNIQRQRADELGREQNRSRELSSDLAFELAQMERERGDFRTTALGEAQQQKFANLLGMGEYGLSRNKAGLDNRLALSNLLMGMSTMPYELAGAALDVQGKQADIGRIRAETDRIVADAQNVGINADSINLGKPEHVQGLSEQLTLGITGPRGNLRYNPNKAWRVLNDVLRRFGVHNPRGIEIARTIMRDVMARSHANNMWKNWDFNKNPIKKGK